MSNRKLSVKQAHLWAVALFIVAMLGAFLGAIYSVEELVNTNQMIYMLTAAVCAYLTVTLLRCLMAYLNELF